MNDHVGRGSVAGGSSFRGGGGGRMLRGVETCGCAANIGISSRMANGSRPARRASSSNCSKISSSSDSASPSDFGSSLTWDSFLLLVGAMLSPYGLRFVFVGC